MNKKRNNKGFTLAELLIVVAIIAVLVAIAIPIFNSQLEKSRDSTSVANMRSAYAEAQTAILTGDNVGNATIDEDAKTVTVTDVIIKTHSKTKEWSDVAGDLPFTAPKDPAEDGKYTIVFTFDDNGVTGTPTLTKQS